MTTKEEKELADLKAENEKLKADIAKAKSAPAAVANPSASDLEDYDKGEYIRSSDGEKFSLKIDEEDSIGRTHKLKNQEHYMELTKPDFKLQFEKK